MCVGVETLEWAVQSGRAGLMHRHWSDAVVLNVPPTERLVQQRRHKQLYPTQSAMDCGQFDLDWIHFISCLKIKIR
jgi:hypothetical protein